MNRVEEEGSITVAVTASIIIPTSGRQGPVRRALQSLLAADPGGRDAEILVVDNNSDRMIGEELRELCLSVGEPVRYLREATPGQTAARHLGAGEARGGILLFLDDDVEVSSSWLPTMLAAFEDPSTGIAGGPSIPRFEGTVPAWLWEFLQPVSYGGWHCGWLSLIDIGTDVDDIDPVWIWGLNFGIRRDLLYQLGGFHPDLVPAHLQRWQGDGETGLALKASAAGTRVVYREGAMVHHAIPGERMTKAAFARRAYYQGVCDSYTAIRSGQSPSLEPDPPRTMPAAPPAAGWGHVAFEVRCATTAAYNEGWTFHQREAARDAELRAWILRDDYFDVHSYGRDGSPEGSLTPAKP
ncbi:MAG TPA: glycosyltransferase family 2 protein [Thermoanaerobaculia bacterium]